MSDFIGHRMFYSSGATVRRSVVLRKDGTIDGGTQREAMWTFDQTNDQRRLLIFGRNVTPTAILTRTDDDTWEGTSQSDARESVVLRRMTEADELHFDFSQYGEQKFILEFFSDARDGYFLDIGAADGVTDSNTRALALRGWQGTLVEPVPEEFWRLEDSYVNLQGFQLINAAVAERDGYGNMWIARQLQVEHYGRGDNRHTLLHQTADEAEKQAFRPAQYDRREVRLICPEMLIARLPGPARFLSVDAEGMDAWIISQLLRRGLDPDLVLFENDKASFETCHDGLRAAGYKQVHSTQANAAWAKHRR